MAIFKNRQRKIIRAALHEFSCRVWVEIEVILTHIIDDAFSNGSTAEGWQLQLNTLETMIESVHKVNKVIVVFEAGGYGNPADGYHVKDLASDLVEIKAETMGKFKKNLESFEICARQI